jgi:fatty acid desaturase
VTGSAQSSAGPSIAGETEEFRLVRQQVTALALARPSGRKSLIRAAGICAVLAPSAGAALYLDTAWMWVLHIVVATVALCTIPAVYHEGTHGNLAQSRFVNDGIAMVVASLHFVPFETWRLFHLAHHAHAGTDDDPEVYPETWSRLSLVAFPIAYWSFVYLLWRWTWTAGREAGPRWIRTERQVEQVRRRGIAAAIVLACVAGASVAEPQVLWLLIVPMVLSVMLASLTLIPEHHPAHRIGSPSVDQLDRTASFAPGPVVRFLMWNSNLHAAHHFVPGVPAHNLPAVDSMIARFQEPEWRHSGYAGWYRRMFRELPWRPKRSTLDSGPVD